MQEIVVYIIGILALVYIAYKIYATFTQRKADPCGGCSGCELRSEFKQKQSQCAKGAKLKEGEGKNSCCR